MKKLLLIRHAKATHESGYADFERPLKPSGIRDAAIMAARLNDKSLIPEILITSPALRTITTANIFAEHLSLPQPSGDKRIYEATEETLVDIVNELQNEFEFIGLVGHNPGLSQLLYYLTGQIQDMQTCGTVLIEFAVAEWGDIIDYSGKLIYYDAPGE